MNRTLTYKNGDEGNIPKILGDVEKRVTTWAQTFAGTLNFSELLKEYKIQYLEEEQLNQVREERLALLLASEIEENEPLWTDYEFEETQVKIDITEMIMSQLFDETSNILQNNGKYIKPENLENDKDKDKVEELDENLEKPKPEKVRKKSLGDDKMEPLMEITD